MSLIPFFFFDSGVWCASAAKNNWQEFCTSQSQQLLRWWPSKKDFKEMDFNHNSPLEEQGETGGVEKWTENNPALLLLSQAEHWPQVTLPWWACIEFEFANRQIGRRSEISLLLNAELWQWSCNSWGLVTNRKKARPSIIERTSKSLSMPF